MHSERTKEAASVLRSLRQLVHALRVTAHSVEHTLGLSGAQLFLLGELAVEPHVSIRRVAERTLTDPSSASVVVARLIERGLVKRRQDETDKRRSVLSVTTKGQAVLRRAPEPYQVKLFQALNGLPRQRLRQLHLGLAALVHATGLEDAVPLFFEGAPTSTTKRQRRGNAV
jgi:DNA-binding MarR family transcriptional regulator